MRIKRRQTLGIRPEALGREQSTCEKTLITTTEITKRMEGVLGEEAEVDVFHGLKKEKRKISFSADFADFRGIGNDVQCSTLGRRKDDYKRGFSH
jgi:hypothetical protein